jgi:hypothetical protein
MSTTTNREPLTKLTVVVIVGSMLVGVFGMAMTLFTLLADWKISKLEARLKNDFALVREIESLKSTVVGVDTKIDLYHMQKPGGGGSDESGP